MLGDGKTPFNGVAPIKIRGEISEAVLYHALFRLQQKHPLLNAVITYDKNNRPYFTATKERPVKIPVEIRPRHSDDDWRAETVKQWQTPFKTDQEPMLRVLWLKGDRVSDILLVIHHTLIDGSALLSIMTAFFKLIDNSDADVGQEDPIKGLADIVPEEVLENRKIKLKVSLISKVATLALWLLPAGRKAVERQRDYLIPWKIEEDMTTEISKLCRNSGITVNTLLCTVLLQAFKDVRKENAHNKISCPVDLRTINRKIKKDSIFAFGSMFVVSAYPELDFMTNAKAIQKDIKSKVKKLDPYLMLMVLEKAHPILHKFSRYLKHGKSSNDCMFSNMGRMIFPYQYGTFEIETIYTPTVIGPLGNTTSFMVSVYRGKMDFAFVASEGYVPYTEGQAIQMRIMAILKEQLQTQLQPA